MEALEQASYRRTYEGGEVGMKDRKTVMSWLEGLTQDDWEVWYSDSEVQETAKAALELLKEQEELNAHYQSLLIAYNDMRKEQETTFIKEHDRINHWHCEKCGYTAGIIIRTYKYCPECGRTVKWDDI